MEEIQQLKHVLSLAEQNEVLLSYRGDSFGRIKPKIMKKIKAITLILKLMFGLIQPYNPIELTHILLKLKITIA